MLTYFLPPLGRIGLIGWGHERIVARRRPANGNASPFIESVYQDLIADHLSAGRADFRSSSLDESASGLLWPGALQLAALTDDDSVTGGHFCGEA